ncbi:MAG: ATP-binding protein [Thermodesulfovibrionales bacterium]
MKKRIIAFLSLLFGFFTIGALISILYITYTTRELKKIITLHSVEILRQDLLIKIQNVERDLLTVHTELGKKLDTVIENVTDLDRAIHNCTSCHHAPLIAQKLQSIKEHISRFETSLSYYITAAADTERIRTLKIEAYVTGSELSGVVAEMTFIANKKLQDRTGAALTAVRNAQWILVSTLIAAFLVGLWIASTLIRNVLHPVSELIDVSKNIASGDLGYTTGYTDNTEFGQLATSMNEMSLSLRDGNEKVIRHMDRLAGLYKVTLPLHSVPTTEEIFKEVSTSVANLLEVEQCGLMLLDTGGLVTHRLPAFGLTDEEVQRIAISREDILKLYVANNGRPLIINDPQGNPLLSGLLGNGGVPLRNILLGWIRLQGELAGMIRLANKRNGNFSEESVRLIGIISNNVSVALENAKLYQDLKAQMQELRETQEQLVQAAKLAAIGELAANVAHEINNPLTSIMGYAELIREETDIAIIMRDIDIISRESLRARNIVQQLLEFARKRPLELREISPDELLKDTVELVRGQLKKARIRIVEEYGSLPSIMGDANQMKQVFLNIINNAAHSMSDTGGILTITTTSAEDHVQITIKDTGRGILPEVLPKIFEPFFTTKQDKGTGLGLSITYKIIQSHNGRIDIKSEVGTGTAFTLTLPLYVAKKNFTPVGS